MRAARLLAAILSIGALSAPLAAFAQQAPTAGPAPSYARPSALNGDETIKEVDTPYSSFGTVPQYPYPGYASLSVGIGFGPVYDHYWH